MSDHPNKPDLRVFISYAHRDESIAKTIKREIVRLYRSNVSCFLDLQDISAGAKWRETIDGKLADTDLLIIVYTGVQSEYVGYEIGRFLTIQSAKDGQKPVIPVGPILVLHDVLTVPSLFSNIQTVRIDVELLTGDKAPRELLATYFGAAIKLLSSFNGIYDVDPTDPIYEDELSKTVVDVAKSFRANQNTDVVSDDPVQHYMSISFAGGDRSAQFRVPEAATLEAPTKTWSLFGFMHGTQSKPDTPTWGMLRKKLLDPARGHVPWMDQVDRDVAGLMDFRLPLSDDTTFVSEGKVYRALPSRLIRLRNGQVTIIIEFAETLNRRFSGLPTTSSLLASIMMSGRYHFKYIEDWNNFKERFSLRLDNSEYIANSKQLLVDLERIEHEGLELTVGDMDSLFRAFGDGYQENIRSTFSVYFEARNALQRAISGVHEPLTVEMRASVTAAVLQFFQTTAENNFRFLEDALSVFQKEVKASRQKFKASALEAID